MRVATFASASAFSAAVRAWAMRAWIAPKSKSGRVKLRPTAPPKPDPGAVATSVASRVLPSSGFTPPSSARASIDGMRSASALASCSLAALAAAIASATSLTRSHGRPVASGRGLVVAQGREQQRRIGLAAEQLVQLAGRAAPLPPERLQIGAAGEHLRLRLEQIGAHPLTAGAALFEQQLVAGEVIERVAAHRQLLVQLAQLVEPGAHLEEQIVLRLAHPEGGGLQVGEGSAQLGAAPAAVEHRHRGQHLRQRVAVGIGARPGDLQVGVELEVRVELGASLVRPRLGVGGVGAGHRQPGVGRPASRSASSRVSGWVPRASETVRRSGATIRSLLLSLRGNLENALQAVHHLERLAGRALQRKGMAGAGFLLHPGKHRLEGGGRGVPVQRRLNLQRDQAARACSSTLCAFSGVPAMASSCASRSHTSSCITLGGHDRPEWREERDHVGRHLVRRERAGQPVVRREQRVQPGEVVAHALKSRWLRGAAQPSGALLGPLQQACCADRRAFCAASPPNPPRSTRGAPVAWEPRRGRGR